MTLDPEDGKLFFDLMWRVQYYLNQKRDMHKNISSVLEYTNLPTEKKLKVRDELWKTPELIEAYVQENPDALPPEQLDIVRKWKGFIKGSYFILRHLKKGSIFISKDDKVYAVHGIQDPLDEIIPSYALPQMVEAVLLPFKGRIIYDGLLSGYRVHFGSGIRSDLNHTYTVAKHKDRIITTLEPDLAAPAPVRPKKDILPTLQELSATIAKVKGGNALQNSALALARSSLELTIVDATGTLTPDESESQSRKLRKAATRLLNLLDIMEEE
jgi:hypothetical protein